MNGKQRAAALVLSAAMATSLAACGSDTSWAASYAETTMPAGVYILNQIDGYYDAQDALKEAGIAWETSMTGDELKKFVLKNEVEGRPAADYISERAAQYTRSYFAVNKLAAERGIALSAEDEAGLQNSLEQLWLYSGTFYTQNGISKDSVLLMTRNYLTQTRLFESIYGEGGEQSPSEEEYKNYYLENRVRVRYLPLTFSSSLSEEEKTALEEKANGYFERAQKGESLTVLIEEYQNELYEEALKAAEEASSSSSESSSPAEEAEPAERITITEGEYDLILTRDSSAPSKTLTDEMFGAAEGEVKLVRDEQAIYIAMRVDPMFSQEDYESLKPSLLQEMKEEEFEQWLAEQGNTLEIVYNEAALKRFTPSKLNFKLPS